MVAGCALASALVAGFARGDEVDPATWIPPELTRRLSKGPIDAVSVAKRFKETVGVTDDEVLMLPNGNVVYVREYLTSLEDLQKRLAAEGLSLLTGGVNLGAVAETIVPSALLQDQGADILAVIRKIAPSYMPREFTRAEVERLARLAVQKELEPSLEGLFRRAAKATGVEPPAFDPIPVPSFQARNDLKTKTHKDWSASYGKADTFLAHADAFFDLAGDANVTQASVNASARVRVFGSQEQSLLEAKGLVLAPNDGAIRGHGSLWMAGKTLFQEEFDTPVLEKNFTFEREVIDVNTKVRWMVGPVPMSGKLGVSGRAGLDSALRGSLLSASASFTPEVSGDAYAEVAVDAEVASAGAGGELKVIEARTRLAGLAALTLDERGEPRLTARVDSQTSLELLRGKLYTFVEAIVPWPDFKKRWSRDLYAWNGIRKDLGHTVAFEKTTTPTKVTLSGDAEPEDAVATDLDLYERKRVEDLVASSDALAKSFTASEAEVQARLRAVQTDALEPFWTRFPKP
jgi:hypothetical protein